MPEPALYFIIWATVMVALCLLNIFFTRRMWGLFKSWRFKNPDVVEPSTLVVAWYRISGILMVIFIVGLGVWLVPKLYARDECKKLLPELERLADTDGAAAVEARARRHGLQVKTIGRAGLPPELEITKDGRPFATLSTSSGARGFCKV